MPNYISLFSGIGAFELTAPSNWKCVGYSEIKPAALEVYTKHFPDHVALGDVTGVTRASIRKVVGRKRIDCVVGGSPCTNLTSLAHGDKRTGIAKGKGQSGLFWEYLRILRLVREMNPRAHFILENNASMSNANREKMTALLRDVVPETQDSVVLNASTWVPQVRRRLFWADFLITPPARQVRPASHTFASACARKREAARSASTVKTIAYMNNQRGGDRRTVLRIDQPRIIMEPVDTDSKSGIMLYRWAADGDASNRFPSRWHGHEYNITDPTRAADGLSYGAGDCCRPISGSGSIPSIIIVDTRFGCRRDGTFAVREMLPQEAERLMSFPDGFTDCVSTTKRYNVLSNSIVVPVAAHVWQQVPRVPSKRRRNRDG